MRIVKLILMILPMFLGVAAQAQEMSMEAKRFSNQKIASGDEIKSDYSGATGRQYVTIAVESTPATLSVQYDVEVEKGKTTLVLKHEGKVIWENTLSANARDESQIELPGSGKYQLAIELSNASGNHDIKWRTSIASLKE